MKKVLASFMLCIVAFSASERADSAVFGSSSTIWWGLGPVGASCYTVSTSASDMIAYDIGIRNYCHITKHPWFFWSDCYWPGGYSGGLMCGDTHAYTEYELLDLVAEYQTSSVTINVYSSHYGVGSGGDSWLGDISKGRNCDVDQWGGITTCSTEF